MRKIGIFFGTDTGTTRLIAKKMAKLLGDVADKPLNVNRIEVAALLEYDALILGTPSYGDGQLPGVVTGVKDGSWREFLPKLDGMDFSGKRIALYGLGNQEKYPTCFAGSVFDLYEKLRGLGAEMVGAWPTEGYQFEQSRSVVDGRFVGLILDQNNQAMLTDDRLKAWLDQVAPVLLDESGHAASAANA